MTLDEFYNSFDNIKKFDNKKIIELFIYFITEIKKQPSASSADIKQCFLDMDLSPPAGLSSRLSEKRKKRRTYK